MSGKPNTVDERQTVFAQDLSGISSTDNELLTELYLYIADPTKQWDTWWKILDANIFDKAESQGGEAGCSQRCLGVVYPLSEGSSPTARLNRAWRNAPKFGLAVRFLNREGGYVDWL